MSDGRKPERPLLWVLFRLRGAEIVIKTVDELYLEEIFTAICEREVPFVERAPEVILLETIRKPADAEGKYIRQVGGSGNYGHVKIRLEPKDQGQDFEFVNGIGDGAIPQQYIASIEKGIREAMRGGVLFGHEIVGVTATLMDGSHHEIDSNETAFRIAASLAFKEAARKASPVLLEPMMELEVVVREGLIGEMIDEINSRRGRVERVEHHADGVEIKAVVPLRETLRSSRRGRLGYPMRFRRYEAAVGFDEGFGDQGMGYPVRNPRHPNSQNRSAADRLKFDSD